MKQLLCILIGLMMTSSVYGQKPDQIIITVIEQTDWTFNKKEELFLRTNVEKNQINYTLDTSIQAYITNEFLIESYYNIWDGDTIVKEKLRTKHKRWSNNIDSLRSKELIISINTTVDTLEKDMSVLHTSHHYMTIYLDLILDNDTQSYYKTKPFKYLTPWFSEQSGSILNPEIDEQLFLMLPEKFIGREKLKLVLTKLERH